MQKKNNNILANIAFKQKINKQANERKQKCNETSNGLFQIVTARVYTEILKYYYVSNEFNRASYLMLDTSFTDCIFVISHTTRHSITEFTFEYEHSEL